MKDRKHLVFLMLLVALLLFSSAKGVQTLVGTTFEAGSGGIDTWPADGPWGNGDDVDSVSGVGWGLPPMDSNGADDANIASVTADLMDVYNGLQSGVLLRRDYSQSGIMRQLTFGDGDNTEAYTLRWAMKYKNAGAAGVAAVGMILGDKSVLADSGDSNSFGGWSEKALAVSMVGDLSGTTAIKVYAGNPSDPNVEKQQIVLGSYADDAYYEFEVTLNFQSKEYRLKVKEVGESDWEADISGVFQNAAEVQSFDWLQCKNFYEGAYGYWDDIKVTVECGSYGYLSSDFNEDCYTDFEDFVTLAGSWMSCTDPTDSSCVEQ